MTLSSKKDHSISERQVRTWLCASEGTVNTVRKELARMGR